MFEWAMRIPGVLRWDQDALVVRSLNLRQASLRELLALFARYDLPMRQLAQFANARNAAWFAAPTMIWHARVFG